jgi:hypothetical protein
MHKGWYSNIFYFDNHILYYLGMERQGRDHQKFAWTWCSKVEEQKFRPFQKKETWSVKNDDLPIIRDLLQCQFHALKKLARQM